MARQAKSGGTQPPMRKSECGIRNDGSVVLFESLFGLALGWILGRARGANSAGVFGPGGESSESTQNEQGRTEDQPGPRNGGNGSHVLGPTEQQTQYAKLGDSDSNSDNSFGRGPQTSGWERFFIGIHSEAGR
jgi:hypothetical protein